GPATGCVTCSIRPCAASRAVGALARGARGVTQWMAVKRWLLAGVIVATVTSTGEALARPSFQKVFVVVLENTDYPTALAQPFLADLAPRGALLTNFFAVTHPSQPNYIAMVAGSTYGVTSSGNVTLNVSHLGDLLEASGRSWKVYAEG